MKIVFSDNGMGMLLNFRMDVIRHYSDMGADVLLVYPASSHREELVSRLPENCRCYCVDVDPTGINPLNDMAYLRALYKIYRRERPDVVFHYTIKPNVYGTIAAAAAGVKARISMVAGLGYVFSGKGVSKALGRGLYKIGLRLSSRVITLNAYNHDLLLRNRYVKKDNIVLFEGGEGVNLSKYAFEENSFENHCFLMVARVLYDKGYKEFVDAARIVRMSYPDARFELLGPIDDSSPMRVPYSVVEKDVADGYITYLGVTDDVPAVMRRKGVVVVLPSSYKEGMNRSLMEAVAMGRPVITTDVSGCKELVDDGINGYVVPPVDAQALADAVIRFIRLSEDDKVNMSKASHQKALKQFDVRKVIEQYDAILNQLGVA